MSKYRLNIFKIVHGPFFPCEEGILSAICGRILAIIIFAKMGQSVRKNLGKKSRVVQILNAPPDITLPEFLPFLCILLRIRNENRA